MHKLAKFGSAQIIKLDMSKAVNFVRQNQLWNKIN